MRIMRKTATAQQKPIGRSGREDEFHIRYPAFEAFPGELAFHGSVRYDVL